MKALTAFKIGPQKRYNHQGAVLFVRHDILGSVAHGSAAAKTHPAVLPDLNRFKETVL